MCYVVACKTHWTRNEKHPMTIKTLLVMTAATAMLAACGQAQTEKAPTASAAAPMVSVPSDLVAGTYQLDPNHANLDWSIQHLSLSNYTARFNKISAELTLDPANLSNSRITATIDPRSVDTTFSGDYRGTHPGTPYNSFDEAIAQDPQMLNAGQFPTITFTSTKVEQTGPTTAKVTGDLTFLGQTQSVTLDTNFVGGFARHPMLNMPAVAFSATGQFRRSEFGMPTGPLGDLVTIRFDGEFTQAAAPAPAAAN